jgi:hypothetical protein
LAGTIIADYIRADANQLSLNVGNTTFATINASGFFSNTGTQIIAANGRINAASIVSGSIPGSALSTAANTIPRSSMTSGAVLQSIANTITTQVSVSSSTWTSSGLSLNITTSLANSKILIMASVGFNLQGSTTSGIQFRVTRAGSSIWSQGQTRFSGLTATGDNEAWAPIYYLDSPNAAAGTTYAYDIQGYSGGTLRMQDATKSSIVLMEIAP